MRAVVVASVSGSTADAIVGRDCDMRARHCDAAEWRLEVALSRSATIHLWSWATAVALSTAATLAWVLMSRPAVRPRRTKGVLGGRSNEVVRSVLDAALVELASSGYAEFRMDEVALRAGVNRTTVYRRWPNRMALVAAVVDRLRTPLRRNPLPDTGALEQDLIEAFARRWKFARKVEGRAWARLLDERMNPDVKKMVGEAIAERSAEWRYMITRSVERRELPAGTDEQLLLDFVHAIVDSRRGQPFDVQWLSAAVRTVLAGARAGALLRAGGKRAAAGRGRRPSTRSAATLNSGPAKAR